MCGLRPERPEGELGRGQGESKGRRWARIKKYLESNFYKSFDGSSLTKMSSPALKVCYNIKHIDVFITFLDISKLTKVKIHNYIKCSFKKGKTSIFFFFFAKSLSKILWRLNGVVGN